MENKFSAQTIILLTLAITFLVISGGPTRADIRAIQPQIVERPQQYLDIPQLWEYLVDETRMDWTTVDELSSEPNDDNTMAMTVTDGQIVNGHISETSDVNDYFKIVITGEPKSMFVELTWVGSAWVNLYMYDPALEPITYLNENTPSPKNLSKWLADPGTYYIRVKALAGDADYQLRIGVCGQHGEPDNDEMDTTGMSISAYKVPQKTIIDNNSDPFDYWMVTIPMGCESSVISLDWFGTEDANLDFEIYDSEGTKLMSVHDSTTFESLYSQNVPSDTYYIYIKAITGRAMYQLVVDAEVSLLELDIPYFEEMVPVWWPPFPIFDDLTINEQVMIY